MNYTVINGEGTIEMQAATVREAREMAQRNADERNEPFFVSGPDIKTSDADEDIGERFDPVG